MSDFLSAVLHPERARTSGRPGWVTAVGLILIPLLIGGLLVWALWKPDQRLDRIQAAVVNQDEPVTVNGQTVPLGRQLAAGLVTSTGDSTPGATATPSPTTAASGDAASVSGHSSTSNFTWVVTNAQDAASGLTDGRYATVVTIPAGFSAAATSFGSDPTNARQATIDIATSDRSRPVDSAVAEAVTSTAVRVLSSQLTTTYLQNVFVGFDTLRGSLQQASDGASQLATGANGVSSGATSLSDGASQLAGGLGQLASGASSASSGASSLASGVGKVASGASSLASGLDQLASGASSAATQAKAGVPGAQQFATSLQQLADGVSGPGGLGEGTAQLATGVSGLKAGVDGLGAAAYQLAQGCAAQVGTSCADLQALLNPGGAATAPATGQPPSLAYLSASAGALSSGAAGLDQAVNHGVGTTPSLKSGLASLAAGGQQLADGVSASATGLGQLAGAAQQSATGAHQLASGVQQAATGASSLASGVSSLASGAQQSSDGASSLASGAGQLASGASQLGGGATTLADGLGGAADKVPGYSTQQADKLAQVVADPVAATGGSTGLFGSASVPFFLVVALWLGALATFVVLGATAPRIVGSTRSSLRLALTSFVPGAVVGAVQGLVLTAAMARALSLTPGGWVAFAALAALVGVVFAAVNQGLVAAFRGTGRFVAVIVAVVGLATAVVSTVPRLLDDVAGVLPIAPARDALRGVVTGGGVGGPVVLLLVWAAIGLALTTAAVARRRVVPAGRLARWVRAA
jgi:putative membrane protein